MMATGARYNYPASLEPAGLLMDDRAGMVIASVTQLEPSRK
jgi:hypothetical protein